MKKKKIKPGLNATGKTRPLSALKSKYVNGPTPDPSEVANLATHHTRRMLQEEFDEADKQRKEKV